MTRITGAMDRWGRDDQRPLSWTDDIPTCPYTGVGFATNQRYHRDGGRCEMHEMEDMTFNHVYGDASIYGVLDGHDGRKVVEYARQRFPVELLLGETPGGSIRCGLVETQVKAALRNSFLQVDRGFFSNLDSILAERAQLTFSLPEQMNTLQTYREHQLEIDRLHDLQIEVAGGTTAVVALVYGGNLYVANVGDSRALLCTSDEHGGLYVHNLTVDHNTKNPNELTRLANLGLNVELLTRGKKLGGLEHTRSLGDYALKGGYKDFDILSMAISEPVIADPHVVGPIPLGQSVSFLVLMSDGVYQSLEEASNCPDVNSEIANLVNQELFCNSTVRSAAQAVLDRICRLHYDCFMDTGEVREHGDMVLLIRNFSHEMKCRKYSSASSSSTSSRDTLDLSRTSTGGIVRPVAVPYSEASMSNETPSLHIPDRYHFQNRLSGSSTSPGIRLIPVESPPRYASESTASGSTLHPDDPFTPLYCSDRREHSSPMVAPLMVPSRVSPCTSGLPPCTDYNIRPSRSDTFLSGNEMDPRLRAASSGPVQYLNGRTDGEVVDQENTMRKRFIKGHRRVPSDPLSVGKFSPQPRPPQRRPTHPVVHHPGTQSRGMHRNVSYPSVTTAGHARWRRLEQRCPVREIGEEYGSLTRQYSDPAIAGHSQQSAFSPTPPRAQTPGPDCVASSTGAPTSGQSRTSTPSSGVSPYHTPPSPQTHPVVAKQSGMGGSVDSGISNMEESDQEQRHTGDTTAAVQTGTCNAEPEGTVGDTGTLTPGLSQQKVKGNRQTDTREEEPDNSGRIVGYLDFSDIHLPEELLSFFEGH